MFAKLLVEVYRLVHGKLHLPGAGFLIRQFVPFVPGLRDYNLQIPSIGSTNVDFRDIAAFGILNYSLGDYGEDKVFLRTMDHFIQKDQILWDIGSNVGYLAMYLALPPHKLRYIYCFEPNPDVFSRLSKLFMGHSIVKTFPIGLGADDAELDMSVPEKGSQIGSLARKVDPNNTIKVTVRSGDNFRKSVELEPPDIIKVDVEGFEPQVLEGLKETVQSSRPIIFFEHIWLSDKQVKALVPPNYTLFLILDDGTLTDNWSLKGQSHNGILLPVDKSHLTQGLIVLSSSPQ